MCESLQLNSSSLIQHVTIMEDSADVCRWTPSLRVHTRKNDFEGSKNQNQLAVDILLIRVARHRYAYSRFEPSGASTFDNSNYACLRSIFSFITKNKLHLLTLRLSSIVSSEYLSGSGVQLLWPLSTGFFGLNLALVSQASISVELISFILPLLFCLSRKTWLCC